MALPAIVQAKALSPTDVTAGSSNAFTSNVTAGNTLIFATYGWYPGFQPTTITDTQSNTWAINNLNTFGYGNSRLFTAVAGSSGSCTITNNGIAGYASRGSFLIEVSGLAASPFDVNNSGNDNTSSPVNAGSITPSVNGSYIVAFFSRGGVFSSYSNNGVFSLQAQDSTNQSCAVFDYVQTTAAAITPDATASVSSTYHIYGQAISFKPAAGAPANTSNFFFGA